MSVALFSMQGLEFLFRWFHYLGGVCWIGMLWYFNFVQGAFFAETDAGTKTKAIQKLVPRALWWFRWGAMVTFISGVLLLGMKGHYGMAIFNTSYGVFILTGAALGTLMFLNVWLVIWPAQKIIIASTDQVAGGGQALPEAAAAGPRALLCSRTNTMFSIAMLFFMGAASHLPLSMTPDRGIGCAMLANGLVILALQGNALKGKLGPLTTVKGVIHCGLGLVVVLYALTEVLT